MKLILMRHCKSDWSSGLPDEDRPLNARGQKSAKALGDWLRNKHHVPTQALVSSASRTQETFSRLALNTPASHHDDLYLAEPKTILDRIKSTQADTLLVVGHNPGIAELVDGLVADPPDHPRFFDYPTGATTVLDMAAGGRVIDFITPRDVLT